MAMGEKAPFSNFVDWVLRTNDTYAGISYDSDHTVNLYIISQLLRF